MRHILAQQASNPAAERLTLCGATPGERDVPWRRRRTVDHWNVCPHCWDAAGR